MYIYCKLNEKNIYLRKNDLLCNLNSYSLINNNLLILKMRCP